MNTAIVITTIFDPTEAIEKFSKLQGYDLVVVGDKKTPNDWSCDNTSFLSADALHDQFELSGLLPYNHYCRKMLGYLYAIKNGAVAIVDTDDDNIPKDDWNFPPFQGNFDSIENEGFVNIYKLFTDEHIWPRGLPLSMINNQEPIIVEAKKEAKIGIWQGLADEDPDVDAIYRLTYNKLCYFNRRAPVFLNDKSISPFNSQNTIFRKELFPLMYLPSHVTFRFTDILRGLIAQPIMWLYGYHLGFTDASVVQKRNPHDFYKDFISEIPMYQHGETVIDIVSSAISANRTICENLYNAYAVLKDNQIVDNKEMLVLSAWLNDLETLR